MSKTLHVQLGPVAVPLVPITHFGRLKSAELESAWQLVGPSASKNLATSPLWKVIAAAYLEGLHHGAESMRKTHNA